MSWFIYQIDKEEKEEGINITLYYTNEHQESFSKTNSIPYQLIIPKKVFEGLKIKSDNIKAKEKSLKDYHENDVIQLEISSKELCDYISSEIKEHNHETYEADLPPEHRFLIENQKELISKGDEYLPLKYLSVDIETIGSVEDQEIILISAYSPQGKGIRKVYVNEAALPQEKKEQIKDSKFKDFSMDFLPSEKELLEAFKQETIDFGPQVILGWNVVDFDFKVIKDRMKHHDIPFTFSSFKGECRLRILSDFFQTSTLYCPGVLVFDVIALLKTNFISFDDYKLDTVAREVLGDQKIELENDDSAEVSIEEKIQTIQNMLENNPKKLIEYNFKDSYLTAAIVEQLKLLELMCKRSVLTGTPLSKVKSPIATLDIMYLKQLHEQGYVAPANFNFSETTPIEGAYVIEPKKGFYKNVFVYDFKSLYPSVIMTFNVDPFTYHSQGAIEAPNGARFQRNPGILPKLINHLYTERDKAKKEKDPVKSQALKTTMNAFYGAVASPKSRFYNKHIGEAITSFARHIIKQTKAYSEHQGHKVVYGDTDSVFLQPKEDLSSFKEKKKRGKDLERELNEYFKTWVEEQYAVTCKLQLELEKLFSHFFIASKKRYVGYDELTEDTIFVGMEAIRGDWTELAKEFQRQLVSRMFADMNKTEVAEFIREYVKKLEEGKFDDYLVYHKKITKPLSHYVKTTPPHVKAARELEHFNGRTVSYVMTKEGPRHVSLLEEEVPFDYQHYIEKQLKGVSDDLLESFGIDFDEVVSKRKQKGLDQFFG